MKLQLFKHSLQELLIPLAGKPGLICAIVLICVLSSIKYPSAGAILLLPIAFTITFFSKKIQWLILITLIFSIGLYFVSYEKTSELNSTSISSKACGEIEAIIPRPSGNAFIINVLENNKHSYRVRITEKRNLLHLPQPGDKICYEASWYPINPPSVPSAFDTQGWLASQKLKSYGKFIHWESRNYKWIPERSFAKFRQWIKNKFERFLPPAETGLLLGLLAGDRSGIPEALRTDFQRSGLVHVLAISGFHVVLLAGILMTFLKATRLPHKIVHILAMILLLIYIPVTGGSPAVQRAVFMFIIPQFAAIFQRTSNTLNSLGIALVFILVLNPQELWNPGFQLSVAATLGILIGGKYNPISNIPSSFKKNFICSIILNFAIEPTYVTLCATFATSPFLIHHFKTLSPLAWLGNIFVVPSISFGMQAGLFALLSPIDFFSQKFSDAASFFLRIASLFTKTLSNSTEASLTVGPYNPYFLLFLSILFLLIPHFKKNFIAKFYILFAILFLSLLFSFQGFSQYFKPSWSITLIDVGQGDSILLKTPSGKSFLIDTGPNDYRDSGKDIIVPFLHHIGVTKLDALIISHPDSDHYGGALSLVKSFPVKELWISDCARVEEKTDWKIFLQQVTEKEIIIRDIQRNFVWKESFFEMQAIHPIANVCKETNESSITFQVKSLNHSAILTGDLTISGEKEILKNYSHLESDVLKLGHHGSKTSNSLNFLKKVNPKLAVISSGRKNRFRHPHKQVTDRLDSLHIPYMNTAKKGTITITFTNDSSFVKTMLD